MMFGLLASRSNAYKVGQTIPRFHIGSLSLLSSLATKAAEVTNSSIIDSYGRCNLPVTVLSFSPYANAPQTRVAHGKVYDISLVDITRKENNEINELQRLIDSLQISQFPSPSFFRANTQQRTFQVMNRNGRKAKRANRGKRPCSRVRRHWKTKNWANTSRRG
mmetsp:Transcript_12976/g.27302  ORF Transcript_12976/g.27302 Transcript_12976/m.27302 type:complete len:163 (+) Transcript_12976:43-531(+)|eukprot:CAMPEP_0171332612 /NCGR_PEP_ID=MMETSP0878-20121228/3472_1 /TAXON_ID=67004 /ORGANISM="Thalassiosira weissflogii, Strain CCMP1336" /LENGTH=162 /DNA_ID=CAMNT_0011833383 /DNA_START=37 /DNA_END=525 /DNA_ORIENTATION=-